MIRKAGWPKGEWQSEPDKIQWADEATGLPCLIVRGPHGGLCGYVGLSEDHAYFGKGYDDVPVEVHGGLTFADKCHPGEDESKGICHLPGPGEPDHVWWLGFDCAHAGDHSPAYEKYFKSCSWEADGHYQYRDVAYVKGQVTALARQLASQSTSSAEPK